MEEEHIPQLQHLVMVAQEAEAVVQMDTQEQAEARPEVMQEMLVQRVLLVLMLLVVLVQKILVPEGVVVVMALAQAVQADLEL